MINSNINERLIKRVLDKEKGQFIYSEIFFNQNENIIWYYREQCRSAIKKLREPILVCDTCGQLIQISGGIGDFTKKTHFKHAKDSEDCPLKTDSNISVDEILRRKFNGQVEGSLHINTKNQIAFYLLKNKENNRGITNVEVEKVHKSKLDYKKWKKPDITSIFNNKSLVFEVQLATTFLDVIIERQLFYKENKTYILWIFKEFENEEDKQKFTQKDIFYSNNRNAFVFDDYAIELSERHQNLILACHFQRPIINNLILEYKWEVQYISLNDLTFDENFKIYFFNVEVEEEKLKSELNILKEKKIQEEKIESELREIDSLKKILNQRKVDIENPELTRQKDKYELLKQLEFENINFDFFYRLSKNNSKSRLLEILRLKQEDITNELIDLFSNNYRLTEIDKKFLNEEYPLLIGKDFIQSKQAIIYNIVLIIMLSKLSININYLKNFKRYERILFSIFSIKNDKVIGFDYKSISQIPHRIFDNKSKPEFHFAIIKAIEVFQGYNNYIVKYDKTYKLQNKLKTGLINSLSQIDKNIISIIFKELKEIID